ncbi:PREDICTED: transmembrane protein 161A isoform X2 [Myotis brandtii]|uniref:transmembrane protein 161A isoform X2 n=1 Tax=Myotis brandtii TaxID=109478 RepID=UPI0007041AE9|nr:PREDICTED: transmembrane protein 161A isoform X2 [Myotis brandtii]
MIGRMGCLSDHSLALIGRVLISARAGAGGPPRSRPRHVSSGTSTRQRRSFGPWQGSRGPEAGGSGGPMAIVKRRLCVSPEMPLSSWRPAPSQPWMPSWFVDFAVYSGGVYLFTEAYYYVLGPARETNIAVFWCLLTVAFSMKMFLTVTRLYFSAEEGGERSVCLTFAFLFLLLAMLVQVVPEETLELGLEPGLASMIQNLEPLLKMQGWDWMVPLVKLAIRVGLSVLGSMLGAFLTFPGLRLAQTHRDALTMSEDRPVLQFLLHTSFLSPLFILWLWTKPIARNFLHQAPFGDTPFFLLSDSAFDSLRLWVLVALCLLRLAVTRPHLQAYLCLAKARVEQLRREAGRIEACEIQRRVVRVYCYLTVVSLQYLTPLILTLNCTLLLKTLGGYSWGLGQALPLAPVLAAAQDGPVGPKEDEAQQAAARITGALGGLLTPLFLRGTLAFLIWWTAACQLLSSLFGLYFHQHLAGS